MHKLTLSIFTGILMTSFGCASVAENAGTAPSSDVSGNAWYQAGQDALAARKAQKQNKRRAKNVILFIGDGMDPTTVAAARIYDGQSRGEDGEKNLLSFERFPSVAFSKTYTTDYQVPDSAGTASAMVTGVKTRSGVLSISEGPKLGDCKAALAAIVPTIAEIAEQRGLSTGVISTARLTHATPASVYAHSAARGWENDDYLPEEAANAGCKDIASQLIDFPYGDGLEVALGGGRRNFMTDAQTDPETGKSGRRKDGRDLVAEWTAKSSDHQYVWNEAQFDAATDAVKLLGLFEDSHMDYEIQRADDKGGEPSLADMTEKAINILSKNEDGYFLMVEAGRIDHAHHAGIAHAALKDTQAYSDAVARARALTNDADTLIIVTADHGHTMAFQGYPAKGTNILGLSKEIGDDGVPEARKAGDGKPYTTLVYANGSGSVLRSSVDLSDGRSAPTEEEATAPEYKQQALIPMSSETHGGQDVTVYASGPNAYLISGVFEQNYIFHVMADALGFIEEP